VRAAGCQRPAGDVCLHKARLSSTFVDVAALPETLIKISAVPTVSTTLCSRQHVNRTLAGFKHDPDHHGPDLCGSAVRDGLCHISNLLRSLVGSACECLIWSSCKQASSPELLKAKRPDEPAVERRDRSSLPKVGYTELFRTSVFVWFALRTQTKPNE